MLHRNLLLPLPRNPDNQSGQTIDHQQSDQDSNQEETQESSWGPNTSSDPETSGLEVDITLGDVRKNLDEAGAFISERSTDIQEDVETSQDMEEINDASRNHPVSLEENTAQELESSEEHHSSTNLQDDQSEENQEQSSEENQSSEEHHSSTDIQEDHSSEENQSSGIQEDQTVQTDTASTDDEEDGGSTQQRQNTPPIPVPRRTLRKRTTTQHPDFVYNFQAQSNDCDEVTKKVAFLKEVMKLLE